MRTAIRTDKSIIGGWWWTVDRWTLAALLGLSIIGIVLVSAASPSVAERLHLQPFYFVYRHLLFLAPSLLIMFGMSMLSRKMIWRVASGTFAISLVLIVLAILTGPEIKGATRWIQIFHFSLQPSEFTKPAFAIFAAWLIARHRTQDNFPGYQIAIGGFLLTILLLMSEPDFGMSFVMASIFGVQIFLSGLPLLWIALMAGLGVAGVAGAYFFFPHVTSRVDRFLDPQSGDNYQVQKSLDAFANGGLFGTGPAHGQVKLNLPDAHADFIFAVAGEELGLLAAIFLVLIFCFIIARSIYRVSQSDDLFIVLGTGGLLTQFALQSLIHMGSSLQLLPAKGMTLPFISYGGSSLLSLGFGMGMLLSLTRKRTQTSSNPLWRGRSQQVTGESYG